MKISGLCICTCLYLLLCHQITTLGRTSSVTVGTVKPERVPSARLVSCRTCALPISSALCATQASSDPWWSMKTEGFVMFCPFGSHMVPLSPTTSLSPSPWLPKWLRKPWRSELQTIHLQDWVQRVLCNVQGATCPTNLHFPIFSIIFWFLSCELLVLVWTSRSTFPGACCVGPPQWLKLLRQGDRSSHNQCVACNPGYELTDEATCRPFGCSTSDGRGRAVRVWAWEMTSFRVDG